MDNQQIIDAKSRTKIIKLALIKLGIKCDLVGFSYLVEAVNLAIDDPLIIYDMKILFAKVADSLHTGSSQRVEANMRNAILSTFKSKTLFAINDMFGINVINEKSKVTTAEVVKLLAEYYTLELYKTA